MLRGHLLWGLWWEVSFRTFSPDSHSYFHKTRVAHLHHYFIERCLCQVKKKNEKHVEKVDSLYIRVYWSLEPIRIRAVATVRSPQQGA